MKARLNRHITFSYCRLYFLITILLNFGVYEVFAQNMIISEDGGKPQSSAMLHIKSSDKGLLMPRMTEAQKLSISSPAEGLMIYQTDGQKGIWMMDSLAGSWNRFLDSTQTAVLIQQLGPDDLGDHTATQNVELDGNYLSNDGGNEGISIADNGNTQITGVSGAEVLKVNGFYGTSGNGSGLQITNSQIQITGNNGNSGDMRFRTGGADRVRIVGSGNVGINEANPSSKLHISATDNTGDIILEDTYPFIYMNTTTSNNAGFHFQDNGVSGFEMYYAAASDNFLINHLNSGGTDMTISSSGFFGIQQASPTVRLQVDGGTDASLSGGTGYLLINDESSTNMIIDDNEIMARNNGVESALHFQADGGEINIHFGQGGTTQMTIEDDGDMVIGTGTAADRMHIYGTNPRFRAQSSTNGYAGLVAKNTQREYFIGVQGSGDPFPGELHIFDNTAGAQRMVMDESGRIGIGQSDPTSALHISYNGEPQILVTPSSTNGQDAAIHIQGARNGSTSNDEAIIRFQNYDQDLGTSSILGAIAGRVTNAGSNVGEMVFYYYPDGATATEGIRLDNTGRVGINTGSPNSMLSIESNLGDLSSGINFKDGNDDWYIYQDPTGQLIFRDDGTDRLIIDALGNSIPGIDNAYDLGTSTQRWDDVYATNGTIQTSDLRLKKDITNLDYGLETVLKLRPVHYQWKDDPDKAKKIGFIAQEVQPLIPEVVSVGSDSAQTLGMRYADMIPVLVKAIQEQQAEIDSLKNEIARIK